MGLVLSKNLWQKFFTLLFLLSFLDPALASSPFTNLQGYKNSLGFNHLQQNETPRRRVRVAVLDKGFFGYENEIGVSLPRSTRYVTGPVANPEDNKVEHGLRMAQILIAMMTDDMTQPDWVPELSLYNVFGFTNFKAAIDDVIARKFDVVLYSEVWEYGGNSDGRGFINREVSRATKAGIIWVNAAGNFAQTTYNSGIQTGADDWVHLPDQNQALRLRCEKSSGTCPVKIVLSWNDFKDDVNLGTTKDLDFALTDDMLNIIQSSSLQQSNDPKEERPGFSKYPREIIAADLKPGTYFVRVKNRSKNFKSRDRLRITVDGDGVVMPSRTPGETLLNPADNASVITVGASDSERSSSSASLGKPDLLAPSSIRLETREEFRGSSNSAAIVAAGVAMIKSLTPTIKKAEVLSRITRRGGGNSGGWEQTGLSLNLLGFGPTGPGCFLDATILPPPYAVDSIQRGGVLVQTTHGARVMTPFDPILLAPYLRRVVINDMIVALPQGGYGLFPRQGMIPQGAVEVFQRPLEAGLCNPRGGTGGRQFSLF